MPLRSPPNQRMMVAEVSISRNLGALSLEVRKGANDQYDSSVLDHMLSGLCRQLDPKTEKIKYFATRITYLPKSEACITSALMDTQNIFQQY